MRDQGWGNLCREWVKEGRFGRHSHVLDAPKPRRDQGWSNLCSEWVRERTVYDSVSTNYNRLQTIDEDRVLTDG